MAVKQVKVDIDIKSGSVKIAGEETMKLSRQVAVLMKELENTPKGTAQFEILSSKLNETKDKMAAVKAQSSELFGTFSMLPGPIGAIGSAANGTLSTLKTFSTFSFKDISTQFKGLFKDVGEVASNVGKATGITKIFNATTTLLAGGLNKVGISANVGSKGLKLFSGALLATGVGALVVGLGLLISNFDKVKEAVYKMFPPLKMLGDAIGSVVNFFTDLIGVTSEVERAEAKRQATFAKAKANTEIVNQGIQREIDLLKAKGATQEEIDKKEKQMIQNQLKDLTAAANERGMLAGEQATQYKDLKNKLLVIDATAAKAKADKDKKDAEDAANKSKTAGDKARQIAEQNAQKDREFRQQEVDAQVQLLKDSTDTDEQTLRTAIEKQYAIKNEGKKLSVDVAKQQANEINKIVEEELNKDVEARKKANDEKIAIVKDTSKLELEDLSVTLEEKKLKYGAESEEVRKTQTDIFAATKAGFDAEKALLDEKSKTKDGLTNDEKNRLKELENANRSLTVAVQTENQRQIESDLQASMTKAANDKADKDSQFQRDFEANTLNIEEQARLLTEKQKTDNLYFEQQLAQKGLNEEQIRALQNQKLESDIFFAGAEEQLDRKRVASKAMALDSIISIFGAESEAGRAAMVAKQILAAKELIMEAKKTITFATIKGAEATVATAAGAAKTAAVGFPQNIPLLIGYAAQAAGIISAIVSAVRGAKAAASSVGGDAGGAPPEQPRKLARGGYVTGPGSGTSDSIPTLLSNGESVINASSTKMFKPLLSTINTIGGGRKFAEGGVVGMNSSLTQVQDSLMTSQQPVKAYVVAQDMSNQQMMDRRIKERSTL